MRRSRKYLTFGFLLGTFAFNIYLLLQFHVEEEPVLRYESQQKQFLILDWTAKHHIFREDEIIQCDFSHITPEYCQSRFDSIASESRRSYFIQRCSHLPTLAIRWTADQSYLKQADLLSYHSIHMPWKRLPKLIRNDRKQQFSTVYVLESEVHSSNGQHWHHIDFPMWYNLQHSYPAPATYFDLKIYLNQLFAPVQVPFLNKTTSASIVWIISNCRANNGRQTLIENLMAYIQIDSYGKCLNNVHSDNVRIRQQSNSILYSSYKFVIAIENSNCEDYVTEKLLDAFASTSIPIVASRNGKPDYARFAPEYSYVNVYDYSSLKELADYLKYLSNNETAYNEYLWFRRLPANKYATSKGTVTRTLAEYLQLADEILGRNATMRQWLLTKETSVNKYCKLAQFIYTTDWKVIDKRKKIDRLSANEVCLPRDDLISHFIK
ncbi:unnamed protein product [Adineta ricciae]|uniref:Fucosyltransferase n=1 Tax=Adineta ricciae TaxID=249248 RepID=A0A813MC48_ADIRI|nr:unnamed protein product [Adineta ricciae]CAF1179811.1 unnamed protein product [Adineta ricciae]